MPDNPTEETAIGRAVRILDMIAADGPQRFVEIQRELGGISPTTVNRILKALMHFSMLAKNPAGSYIIGERLQHWQASNPFDLRVLARPAIEKINAQFKVSCTVWEFRNQMLHCLDRVLDETSPALACPGAERPIEIYVLGGAFFMPDERLNRPEQLRAELAKVPCIVKLEQLQKIVNRLRKKDYYDDLGAFFPGSRRLAVPIRSGKRTIGVLGVGLAPTRAADKKLYAELLNALQVAAVKIGEQLKLSSLHADPSSDRP